MSTRLGIELVLEPAFTARSYRARQIICGQYASWAAEMHMLRLSLVSYFQCADTAVDQLLEGAVRLADDSRQRSPAFSIECQGVANGETGDVYLDFQQTDPDHPLMILQREALALAETLPGAESPADSGEFHARINLMEFGNLLPSVMADAAEFAKGVAADIGVPSAARAWRLVILRYYSEAAGDDWTRGGWAPDLRWEYLASNVL